MVYDYYHYIIPDSLTVAVGVFILLTYGYQLLISTMSWSQLGVHAAYALAGAGFFFVLWLVSKGRWLGFGDVKLAFPLGLLVGASSVFSFIVISFWIGAIVSLLLLGFLYVTQKGKSDVSVTGPALTMKSAVPFAPFLIAGALVTFFSTFNVLSLFTI